MWVLIKRLIGTDQTVCRQVAGRLFSWSLLSGEQTQSYAEPGFWNQKPQVFLWSKQIKSDFCLNPLRVGLCQRTTTMGSTVRMSVRTCWALKSTCASLLCWDLLEEAWLGCEEALPRRPKACLGLELSPLSGQAALRRWLQATVGPSSRSNPITALLFLQHTSKSSLSSLRKAGFRQQ